MIKIRNTYFVCPLNWGLGHSSRMIPVIEELLSDNHEVIIGGDGPALQLLKNTFPNLTAITIPDVKITFSSKGKNLQLLQIALKLFFSIHKEHNLLKKILKKHNINVIISDNRYGLWNNKIKSIIYTHQLMVKLPKNLKRLEYPVHLLIKKLLSRFDECRIPDYKEPEKSLAGDLTHKYRLPKNAFFTGPLSHFKKEAKPLDNISNYDIVAILSGPEPARGELESLLLKHLKNTKFSILIIKGITDKENVVFINNFTITNTLPSDLIKHQLLNCKYIICRSGYSSIMDLHELNKKAIIIPTPGQTEQEYIASFHSKSHNFITQNELLHIEHLLLKQPTLNTHSN